MLQKILGFYFTMLPSKIKVYTDEQTPPVSIGHTSITPTVPVLPGQTESPIAANVQGG